MMMMIWLDFMQIKAKIDLHNAKEETTLETERPTGGCKYKYKYNIYNKYNIYTKGKKT